MVIALTEMIFKSFVILSKAGYRLSLTCPNIAQPTLHPLKNITMLNRIHRRIYGMYNRKNTLAFFLKAPGHISKQLF